MLLFPTSPLKSKHRCSGPTTHPSSWEENSFHDNTFKKSEYTSLLKHSSYSLSTQPINASEVSEILTLLACKEGEGVVMLAMTPVRTSLKFYSIFLSLLLVKRRNKSTFLCFHYNDTTQHRWTVESAIKFPLSQSLKE